MDSPARCLECSFVMLYAGALNGKAVFYCDHSECNRYAILVFKLEA